MTLKPLLVPLLCAVTAVTAGLGYASLSPSNTLSGVAHVIDGDTIVINETHIRLFGIDAPERRQTCDSKTGDTYECGRDSAAVLTELMRGRKVTCAPKDRDRYDRVVAVCFTETLELNAEMVRRGWAVVYAQYAKGRYNTEEAEAQREGRGIWSGRFDMPAEWRHRNHH